MIGEDRSEMLDLVRIAAGESDPPTPLRLPGLRGGGGAGPRAGAAIIGGMATEALLAHVLVAKYGDFLPLYRQAQIFALARDRARPLRSATGWAGPAGGWSRSGASCAGVAGSAGSSPRMAARCDPGRGRTKTGVLVGLCGRRPTLGRRDPAGGGLPLCRGPQGRASGRHLAEFQNSCRWTAAGKLSLPGRRRTRSDSRSVERIAGGLLRLHRSTGSLLAEEALRRIGELYKVEAEIRGRSAEERRTIRQERSKPLVEALHAWLTIQLGRVSVAPLSRGDPLRPAPLAGAGAVPRGRPARAGHERHRAGDRANCPQREEHPIRRVRWWGSPLGDRGSHGDDNGVELGVAHRRARADGLGPAQGH